jgi:hypothetical protein
VKDDHLYPCVREKSNAHGASPYAGEASHLLGAFVACVQV